MLKPLIQTALPSLRPHPGPERRGLSIANAEATFATVSDFFQEEEYWSRRQKKQERSELNTYTDMYDCAIDHIVEIRIELWMPLTVLYVRIRIRMCICSLT